MYSAFQQGEADPLPELEIQYADYAVWQRKWVEGEILQRQAEYWKEALAGAPALLELPADHARPAQQDYRGSLCRVVLDEKLTAGLKELSRRHGTTLFMTLLAGLGSTTGTAVGSAGCGDWHAGGQPRAGGDREADWFLRQHAGAAYGSVGLADSVESCWSESRRRLWRRSSIRIFPSSRWWSWRSRCAVWHTVHCFR